MSVDVDQSAVAATLVLAGNKADVLTALGED